MAIVLPIHYGFISQRRLPTSLVTLDKNVRFLKDCTQKVGETSAFLSGEAYNAFPAKLCCPAAASAQKQSSTAEIMIVSCDFGSHVDSPAHFIANGRSISDLTGQELFAPAVIVDISSRVPKNINNNNDQDQDQDQEDLSIFNVAVTVDDLKNWEQENGRQIPDGAIVAMKSGWSELFNCGRAYNNFDRKGVMHFPGFSKEAVDWLHANRRISGLGVDTLSVDVGNTTTYPVHHANLGKSLFNVENMDLSSVSSSSTSANCYFLVAPLKVQNAPEAPCRCIVVEVLDE